MTLLTPEYVGRFAAALLFDLEQLDSLEVAADNEVEVTTEYEITFPGDEGYDEFPEAAPGDPWSAPVTLDLINDLYDFFRTHILDLDERLTRLAVDHNSGLERVRDALEAMTDYVDAVATNVNDTRDGVNETRERVNAIDADLQDNEDRIHALCDEVGELRRTNKAKLDELAAKFGTLLQSRQAPVNYVLTNSNPNEALARDLAAVRRAAN